jgi:hypothetical protein
MAVITPSTVTQTVQIADILQYIDQLRAAAIQIL